MKMQFKSRYLLFVFVSFFLFSGLSPAFTQYQNLYFKHLSVENGLSQSTVRSIFQDKLGFMWFGTDIGINKYDGADFTVYKYNAADPNGIPSNYVVDIFEDSFGVLWIATGYAGLCRFDREREVFITYVNKPDDSSSISNNSIRAIYEDSKKNLWIGTAGGGLNLYNRQSDSFIHFYHDSLNNSDIGSNYISSIAEDKNGFLWFGSLEGMLTKYDVKTQKGLSFKLFRNDVTDLQNSTFGKVYIDTENNVCFGTEIGLFVYDQKKAVFQHFVKGKTNKFLNENAVTSVIEPEKGVYLIATDHGGLNIYNKKTGTFTYHKHSMYDNSTISNDQLYDIYQSPDGIIWIGSYHGGINIPDRTSMKFKLDNVLANDFDLFNNGNSVTTICEDKDGNIWFGYDGQGIDILHSKTRKIEHMQASENTSNAILSNSVVEIFRDRSNNMWIGTYLKGMSKIDWKTRRFTHYQYDSNKPDGIGGNNVWTILEDNEGFFWIGLQGNGLDRLDPKTNKFIHFKHDPKDPTSLSNNEIYKVFQDIDGNIWVGTRNGLCLFNKKTGHFTRFVSGEDITRGIFGKCIYDIYQDADSNMWIGTDQALNLYDAKNKTFQVFQETDGLNGNAVLSITSDKNNNLWISTNKGLSRFNLKKKRFRNYDVADGLQSSEFNYVSVLNSSTGKLYFGGKSGFNVFYPDSITDNPRIPPVFFTRLTVLNIPIGPRQNTKILTRQINFEKKITLTYKQSVFSIKFAALNFTNPEKNQYAYWLKGFDNGWNYIGNKQEVTYTNLNPGKYLLMVKGSNNDGIWNENGASLQIIILPPIWKTWWFRILLSLTLIGLLIAFYYIRLAFYKSQQTKLLHLVRERTFQLEEVAVILEEKQEEINSQNEELMAQKDELEKNNSILTEQKLQILDQNAELFKHRNQLETLVEERTSELMEAKDKAEESDRLKSSFLANLSHEIRTPLNAILGFSSLLGDKAISDQEREEYNGIIQGSSSSLLDLISDILDISKIEAGQMELNLREVSLGTVIHDLVGIFDLFMRRDNVGSTKPVQLKMAIGDELLRTIIMTDNLRLTQVISNLINNAIKFTSTGYIEVGCTKLPKVEMLEFYVKDTGIGIKEENQQLVFERFRKIEDDKSTLRRGTGLGLAISYQLVNLLGGSMRLTSKVGEGSVFYFTIPLIKSDSPYLPVQRDEFTSALPDFNNCPILVAEDDMANFNYIDKLLKRAKAKVIHAANGKQVLNLLKNNYDVKLILMDIKMPEMDGIETLHELRKINIRIPVIAQTAYALADEVVRLKKEGFDEYISKPIQREYLYFLISKYLNPGDNAAAKKAVST